MIRIEWAAVNAWSTTAPSTGSTVVDLGYGVGPTTVEIVGTVVDDGVSPTSGGMWADIWPATVDELVEDLNVGGAVAGMPVSVSTAGMPAVGSAVVVGSTITVTVTLTPPVGLPVPGIGRPPVLARSAVYLPGGLVDYGTYPLHVVYQGGLDVVFGTPIAPLATSSGPPPVWVTPTLLRVFVDDGWPVGEMADGPWFALSAAASLRAAYLGLGGVTPGPDQTVTPDPSALSAPYAVAVDGWFAQTRVDPSVVSPPGYWPEPPGGGTWWPDAGAAWSVDTPSRGWRVDVAPGTVDVLTFEVAASIGTGAPYFDLDMPTDAAYTSSWPAGETWTYTVEVWINTTPPPPVSTGWRVGVTAGSPTGWTCVQH